ncbi:MAG TPA: DNA internalization-related competence protein ComEC/Rec2, partial [Candidatus Binataceae bacterium]|nr:DNA internalization-related competence protein ComEC/Rec2 [Candidatus Binataceae bacterium]
MAAVAASVPNLVVPEREEIARRAPAPWFVRCPPIYVVALAIVIGDALGSLGFAIPIWIPISAGAACLVLFLMRAPSIGVAMAALAIMLASTIPAHQMIKPAPDPKSISAIPEGAMLLVEGDLIREAEHFPDKMRLYVGVDRVLVEGAGATHARGVLRLTTLHRGVFRLGDRVRFEGRIRFPRNFGDPGEFDYEAFMRREGIDATMLALKRNRRTEVEVLAHHRVFLAGAIEDVRAHIATFTDRNLDDPAAAEMRALIIGDRGGIDERMHETFGRTGLAHLLVISGLHLSMVGAAVFGLARLAMLLFPMIAIRGWANKIAAMVAALAVIAYAAIAGHHVSTTRALIMVLAYMLAVVIDRAREAIASLALACIVICIAMPGSSGDVGFELSFASVLTIVLGMRCYAAWLEARRADRIGIEASQIQAAWEWVLGYLAVSFWAMLGVAPLTAYYFNQVSLIGVLANAITVPVMALGGTIIGLTAAAMSFIWMPAAIVPLWVAGHFIVFGNLLAMWFAQWPWAWMHTFTPTPVEIAFYYSLLLLWLTWPQRRIGMKLLERVTWRHAIAVVLMLGALLDAKLWFDDRFRSDDLRVAFLSVGEGDAAVVRFPGARVMVIDGGSAWRDFDLGERIVARYLWANKIMRVDWIALSHPDQDHFGGLDFIARNFSPHEFWDVAAENHDVGYEHLLGTLYEQHVPIRQIDATSPAIKFAGVRLAALNPRAISSTSRNNASMVLRLDYRGASILFTGDLEAAGEDALIESSRGLQSTILKVPHHGSRTS